MLYKNMKQVPLGVRMIVYQMHERCDGSGYPRGCTGEKIHPLAKIASVADAYVALVSPRPHRPAMLPYHAIAKMLADVKAGLYDSTVVRGLAAHGLAVSDRLVRRAERRPRRQDDPRQRYRRTIGRSSKSGTATHLSAAPQLVDLAEQADLKVVKALTTLQ